MNKKIFYKNQFINLKDHHDDLFNIESTPPIKNNEPDQLNLNLITEDSEIEYETSIRFKIPFSIFSYYKNLVWNKIPNKIKKNVIYINDDGYDIRIHSDRFQKKTELERANYLLYLDGKFIPYSQTKSMESLAYKCIDFSKIQTIVTRYIFLEYIPYDTDELKNIRIVFESISNEKGIDYMFAAEVEFSEEVYNNAKKIYSYNQYLFEYIRTILNPVWANINIKYDVIEPENVLNIPSRIFHPFHQIDVTNYLIKYKFDGYKGKMIYTKNNFYYFDDLQNFSVIIKYPNIFKTFENIIFQFEIVQSMDLSISVIVLTDIIGVYIHGILYTLKPTEVLNVFKYIASQLDAYELELDSGLIYPLQLQKSIPTEELNNSINLKYDGYIIVSNELEIKYKVPTCDARLYQNMLYIDNMNEPITSDMFYGSYSNDQIYEISINSSGSIYILRKRHDRMFTSTIIEYNNFVDLSQKMLLNKLL